jgi:hypothetical protein
MSRMLVSMRLLCCAMLLSCMGCASRPGWGFSWGQGTTNRQKSRAAVHDPFPLNDIGPEVVGGRPREYFNPQAEAARHQVTQSQARFRRLAFSSSVRSGATALKNPACRIDKPD